MGIKLVSSDLNGTLVHQHTMSDMIRQYIGENEYQKADTLFKKQTAGEASMEVAFGNAGPLTRGLTLRQAISYTYDHMQFVGGFCSSDEVDAGFVAPFNKLVISLKDRGAPFVINSTGYSVTIDAIRAFVGEDKIHGQIGNHLVFANGKRELDQDELEKQVFRYFREHGAKRDDVYDRIKATGEVVLGIPDEAAKATLLEKYVHDHNLNALPEERLHLGDTMGDSGGIYSVAKAGGIGVAFNYNGALEKFLKQKIAEEPELKDRIHFVDPKGQNSDLRKVLDIIRASDLI